MGVPRVAEWAPAHPDIPMPGVTLAPYESVIGRIQRTKRYENIIAAVEERYQIPKGTIAALVMNESMGSPVMPNRGGDGGLGLIHFQPPTAVHFGMEIVGQAHKKQYKDPANGRSINHILKECNNSLHCVAKYDDRAHVLYNLDATARMLREGYSINHSWDGAIRYFNPGKRGYVGRILGFRAQYNSDEWSKKAKADFKARNPKRDFGDYIGFFHDHNVNNWGLGAYKRLKRVPLNAGIAEIVSANNIDSNGKALPAPGPNADGHYRDRDPHVKAPEQARKGGAQQGDSLFDSARKWVIDRINNIGARRRIRGKR
jgi:hypothetical protein